MGIYIFIFFRSILRTLFFDEAGKGLSLQSAHRRGAEPEDLGGDLTTWDLNTTWYRKVNPEPEFAPLEPPGAGESLPSSYRFQRNPKSAAQSIQPTETV